MTATSLEQPVSPTRDPAAMVDLLSKATASHAAAAYPDCTSDEVVSMARSTPAYVPNASRLSSR